MREVLDALAAGEIGVREAESRLAGYATTDAGRFDAARETRRGIPEAILADGKTAAETGELARTAVETAGRAIVTRIDAAVAESVAATVTEAVPGAEIDHDERTRTLVARAPEFEPPALDARVSVITGGTSDAPVAGEAAIIAREIGADVELIEDVGVASLVRIVDQIDRVRDADVAIVAAGREGALPTVVAGLVDAPVIALPVSTGYGVGGEGEAALHGALQSCTVVTAVNVDAGFVAGAQAGLIARGVAAARGSPDGDAGDETEPGDGSAANETETGDGSAAGR
ncbi:nickel pincer cofactor biosynthesis protein LarB [Halopenitus persicus]|uniref:nickel pincer cofactor biosynthesis protein LarB n=1 Tax=Halopenitus persicus TaxID=1048396 RepID=UPI000BBB44E8|nr:nickel pincer cofactor biosynthesis protein LarB [Halopenitus persicus]